VRMLMQGIVARAYPDAGGHRGRPPVRDQLPSGKHLLYREFKTRTAFRGSICFRNPAYLQAAGSTRAISSARRADRRGSLPWIAETVAG